MGDSGGSNPIRNEKRKPIRSIDRRKVVSPEGRTQQPQPKQQQQQQQEQEQEQDACQSKRRRAPEIATARPKGPSGSQRNPSHDCPQQAKRGRIQETELLPRPVPEQR